MVRLFSTLLIILVISACNLLPDTPTSSSDQPPIPTSSNPYSPQPGDEQWARGPVYIDSSELIILESYPPQIKLIIGGNLPDPCHQLRLTSDAPDDKNHIMVNVYSIVNPIEACIQVLEPFLVTLPLGTFPIGHYSVWVNDEQIGEFDS